MMFRNMYVRRAITHAGTLEFRRKARMTADCFNSEDTTLRARNGACRTRGMPTRGEGAVPP